jgi:hypothetical protein
MVGRSHKGWRDIRMGFLDLFRRNKATHASPSTPWPTLAASSAVGKGTEPSPEIRSWISVLGRNDLLGPETHRENLIRLGNDASRFLLPLLDLPLRMDRNDIGGESPEFQNNVTVVAAVAAILGELRAKEAVPKLRVLAQSNYFEVQRDARTALLAIEGPGGNGARLRLDRVNPYRQIADLWTTIFQGRRMPVTPPALKSWVTEAVAAIADLQVPEGKRGNAWAMLGALYYKSLNPEWDGSPSEAGPCPEAKRCYQEALKIQNVGLWEDFMRRM